MFNYLYRKEALDLFIYLFHNKALGEYNKDKIKNILYVSYTYIQLNFNDMKIEKVMDYFSHIESIDYLDNLMLNNEKIKKYYNLYPIHNDLLDGETKNRYIEGLEIIKEEISKLNISEYAIYINDKNEFYNLLEQSMNEKISLEQLKIYQNMFLKKIEKIGKYIDKYELEEYKMYFKVRIKKNKLKDALKIFKNKINNFRELDLLKDLKYKTNYATKLGKNNLETINLYKKELNNLRKIQLKKIMLSFIFFLVVYLFSSKFYFLIFDKVTKMGQVFRILVITTLSIFIILSFLSLLKKIISFILIKDKIKGQVGFICKKENNKSLYNVYLPKYNKYYIFESTYCTNDLKESNLVILVKIINNYYLINCEESRFL